MIRGIAFAMLVSMCTTVVAQSNGLVKELPPGVKGIKTEQGYMIPYRVKLSKDVEFEMIPVPGGKFRLGNPDAIDKEHVDEGPVVEVEIAPFWIGKHEVTWGEYMFYMGFEDIAKGSFQKPPKIPVTDDNRVDAVSAPSSLYDPTYNFGHGEDKQMPAVTMTQYAAKQYTKWLSGVLQEHYRLPNEAEWEYACRAGATTKYCYGDDPKQLTDYAWIADNSDEKPHKVGLKKPNAWGIHDMHGNVMEWTLDAYNKLGYRYLTDKKRVGLELTHWPKQSFPCTLRGGSFDVQAKLAACTTRYASDYHKLQDNDPDNPKSPWWMTDDPARSIGLRIIRPLQPMNKDQQNLVWDKVDPKAEIQIKERLDQGRGALGIPEPLKPKKE
jgi:formylglycine-generating enzyme